MKISFGHKSHESGMFVKSTEILKGDTLFESEKIHKHENVSKMNFFCGFSKLVKISFGHKSHESGVFVKINRNIEG